MLTRKVQLVSGRSQSNYSSGFFELYVDNDNILRLLFDGPEVSDIYWPDPEFFNWESWRSAYNYNNSRIAVLDSKGNFTSTDGLTFKSADYGLSFIQRRLTIDFDGKLRLYSRRKHRGGGGGRGGTWVITWQAFSQPRRIHGSWGPNSVCSYIPSTGMKCSCLPGYKLVNDRDWSFGYEPEEFNLLSCATADDDDDDDDATFLQLSHVEFFG